MLKILFCMALLMSTLGCAKEKKSTKPRLLISLAFDDGWKSQKDHAVPLLEQYGFKATFYIITKFLSAPDPRYMNKEEIINLYQKGYEIGGHTITHPNLVDSPDKAFEIKGCKEDLEKIGIQVRSFSYPFGKESSFIDQIPRIAGYQNARIVGNTFNTDTTTIWRLVCQSIEKGTRIEQVEKWLEEAQEKNYWTIFLFHQTEDTLLEKQKWGCTTELFKEICKLLKDKNAEVETVTKAQELYFSH